MSNMKLFTKFLHVAAILLSTLTIGVTPVPFKFGGRIIGGANAAAGQLPFAAAVNVQTSNSRYFCGGTILNQRWIVTSGTCVNNGVLFTIHIGATTLNDSSASILASSEYVLHEEFDANTLANDIGGIRLRSTLEYGLYINRIFLPSTDLEAGDTVVAMGWGQTNDFDSQLADHLQFVELEVLSQATCRAYYGSQLTEGMICVGGNFNEGSCIGDTGSTLVMWVNRLPFLVGIASFISQNGCESVEPSGYTRVETYLDWIRNVTGG